MIKNLNKMTNFLTISSFSYFEQIKSEYPPATKEENEELAKRMNQGDMEARDLLILKNIGLVREVIRRKNVRGKSYELQDIIQEGIIGLIRATETYDYTKGAFSTYAVEWITARMFRNVIHNDELIRRPVYFAQKRNQYLKLIANGQKFDDEELCDILDIPIETLEKIKNDNILNVSSLQESFNGNNSKDGDSDTEIGDMVGQEDESFEKLMNQEVDKELKVFLRKSLPPLQYYILHERILCDKRKAMLYLAKELHISKERIHQLEIRLFRQIHLKYASKNKDRTLSCPLDNNTKNQIQYLKDTPISPKMICLYHFLKDDLNGLLKDLLYESIFGDFDFNPKIYSSLLNVDKKDLLQAWHELNAIINQKVTKNMGAFDEFKNKMMSDLGTSIYSFSKDSSVTKYKKNDESIFNTWKDKSFNDLLRLVKDDSVPTSLYEQVQLFFTQDYTPNTPTPILEQLINDAIFVGGSLFDLPKNTIKKGLLKFLRLFTEIEKDSIFCFVNDISKEEFKNKYPQQEPIEMASLSKLYRLYFGITEYKQNKAKTDMAHKCYSSGSMENIVNSYINDFERLIKGKTSYANTLESHLKFFPKAEQRILMDVFENRLSLESITQKYSKTSSQIVDLSNRFISCLSVLFPTGIDFDYLWNHIYDEDVPYFGDMHLAAAILDCYFEQDLTTTEIQQKYSGLSLENIENIIDEATVALMKHKCGVKVKCRFSYHQIRDYYLAHEDELTPQQKATYSEYFRNYRNFLNRPIPKEILSDLLPDSDYYIHLNTLSKEEILDLLKENRTLLPKDYLFELCDMFDIPTRDLLSEKELSLVIDFLRDFEVPIEPKTLTIKPN